MPTIISTIMLHTLSKNGAPQSTYQCQMEIKESVAAIKIQTVFRGYLVSLSYLFSLICVTLKPLCISFTFTAKFLTRGFILIIKKTIYLGHKILLRYLYKSKKKRYNELNSLMRQNQCMQLIFWEVRRKNLCKNQVYQMILIYENSSLFL